MPLGKCFVKRFVVVFLNYYIFSRRLASHAQQPMRRAFQAFRGVCTLANTAKGVALFDFGRRAQSSASTFRRSDMSSRP